MGWIACYLHLEQLMSLWKGSFFVALKCLQTSQHCLKLMFCLICLHLIIIIVERGSTGIYLYELVALSIGRTWRCHPYRTFENLTYVTDVGISYRVTWFFFFSAVNFVCYMCWHCETFSAMVSVVNRVCLSLSVVIGVFSKEQYVTFWLCASSLRLGTFIILS